MDLYTLKTHVFRWSGTDYHSEYTNEGAFSDCKILYKYRNWDNKNHKLLLTDSVIYLASPESFEDELDCHAPEEFPSLIELPMLFYRLSFKYLPNNSHLFDRIKFVIKWCRETPLANKKEREELSAEFYKEFCERFGVLSLTADSHNDKMWNKYADNHRGFCIGYNKAILEKYVGGGCAVVYTDILPPIRYFKDDIMTQHFKNIFIKTTQWSFEKEYRVHKLWPHKASAKERNIKIAKDAISEVVLGSQMSTENRKNVCHIVSTKYPNAIIREEYQNCDENNSKKVSVLF